VEYGTWLEGGKGGGGMLRSSYGDPPPSKRF